MYKYLLICDTISLKDCIKNNTINHDSDNNIVCTDRINNNIIKLKLININNDNVLAIKECNQNDLCEQLPSIMSLILLKLKAEIKTPIKTKFKLASDAIKVVFNFEQKQNITTVRILKSFIDGLSILN